MPIHETDAGEVKIVQANWLRWMSVVALIGYWAALAIATHIPSVDPLPSTEGNHDKIAHFVAFGGLSFLIAWASFVNLGSVRPLVTLAMVVLYGLADEWLQRFVPTRVPDVMDWLADMAGAGVGLAAAAGAARFWRHAQVRLAAASRSAARTAASEISS